MRDDASDASDNCFQVAKCKQTVAGGPASPLREKREEEGE